MTFYLSIHSINQQRKIMSHLIEDMVFSQSSPRIGESSENCLLGSFFSQSSPQIGESSENCLSSTFFSQSSPQIGENSEDDLLRALNSFFPNEEIISKGESSYTSTLCSFPDSKLLEPEFDDFIKRITDAITVVETTTELGTELLDLNRLTSEIDSNVSVGSLLASDQPQIGGNSEANVAFSSVSNHSQIGEFSDTLRTESEISDLDVRQKNSSPSCSCSCSTYTVVRTDAST